MYFIETIVLELLSKEPGGTQKHHHLAKSGQTDRRQI